MRILEVIPFSRSLKLETLSYYSPEEVAAGSVISVPLRGKSVPSIVVSAQRADEIKGDIKSAGFQIRKISTRTGKRVVLDSFVKSIREIADYFATAPGSVLFSLTPIPLFNNVRYLEEAPVDTQRETDALNDRLLFQTDTTERYSRYRGLIRESFARNQSVFILCPTIADVEYAKELLEKGIETFVVTLHGDLPIQEMRARWNHALREPHPILVIATAMFLSLPRADIATIILERENSRAYKMNARPYLDFRDAARIIARNQRARFILADLPLRVESVGRMKKGLFDEFTPLKGRVLAGATSLLVDMRKEPPVSKTEPELISGILRESLLETERHGRRSFILTARRGLAPLTICGDCQNTVTCTECGANVVLHRASEKNLYLCHACGTSRSANVACQTCRGWKLKTLGVGLEGVHERLRVLFPKRPIFVLDRDAVPNHRRALEVKKDFHDTPGSILIGTEMAMQYIREVELAAVASIDSMLLLPEWRSHERAFALLMNLRERATEKFIVQTRRANERLLELALAGNVASFIDEELVRREEFRYPPSHLLIRLTVTGTKAKVSQLMTGVEENLKEFGVLPYAPAIHAGKGLYVMHALIRTPREGWPNTPLLEKLRTLPLEVQVNVSPENLL